MKRILFCVCIYSVLILIALYSKEKEQSRVDYTTTYITAKSNEAVIPEESKQELVVAIDGETFSTTLYDNDTTQALLKKLPLNLTMEDLHHREKYFYFNDVFPTQSTRQKIRQGDIMLYENNCLVVFYKDFNSEYRYTPIAHIEQTNKFQAIMNNENIKIQFKKR